VYVIRGFEPGTVSARGSNLLGDDMRMACHNVATTLKIHARSGDAPSVQGHRLAP
jgi:hypothetical protein